MTVLTIRAHKRYAMRMPVTLQRKGERALRGLLIELSQQGARISNLGAVPYDEGDGVTLEMRGGRKIRSTVRWVRGGVAGLRLDTSLHLPEMHDIIADDRSRDAEDLRSYGT